MVRLSSRVIHKCFLFSETNQLEDPRQIWHEEQELMLKEYVSRGEVDIEVCLLYITSFHKAEMLKRKYCNFPLSALNALFPISW